MTSLEQLVSQLPPPARAALSADWMEVKSAPVAIRAAMSLLVQSQISTLKPWA